MECCRFARTLTGTVLYDTFKSQSSSRLIQELLLTKSQARGS